MSSTKKDLFCPGKLYQLKFDRSRYPHARQIGVYGSDGKVIILREHTILMYINAFAVSDDNPNKYNPRYYHSENKDIKEDQEKCSWCFVFLYKKEMVYLFVEHHRSKDTCMETLSHWTTRIH